MVDDCAVRLGVRTHFQIFSDGHAGENLAPFWYLNNALAYDILGRHLMDFLSLEYDRAFTWTKNT